MGTYLDDCTTDEQELDLLDAICEKHKLSRPCAEETTRLGIIYCRSEYFKAYRVMTLEQLDAATAYFISLGFTEEELEDEENNRVNKVFIDAENSWLSFNNLNRMGATLVNNDFTRTFSEWLFDNGYDVELNTGMVHWITCLIESYSAG